MTSPTSNQRPAPPHNRHTQPEDFGFGRLFHLVREAIIVLDATTQHIVLWNPAAEGLFGYSREEAVGKPVEVFAPPRLHEDLRSVIEAHADSWQEGRPLYERQALHRSGREIWIEYTATPISWQGETFIIAIVRDCTERKELEAQRDAVLAAAQELARHTAELASMKADFTAMVAHELASPLATIQALIDLIDRPELTDTARRHALETIRTEAGILHRLAADIQGAARVERDDFTVHLAPVPLTSLLEDAAASMRSRLASHDLHVESSPDIRVMADATRIGQVLRNLLDNASRHTPPGTRVVLRARRGTSRTEIQVVDNGPGFAADEFTHVLEKFARGKEAEGRSVPGVGLGLYLSRLIVEAHGGHLEVRSGEGETTIRFDLAEAPDG